VGVAMMMLRQRQRVPRMYVRVHVCSAIEDFGMME
jgi:hypothetical protein